MVCGVLTIASGGHTLVAVPMVPLQRGHRDPLCVQTVHREEDKQPYYLLSSICQSVSRGVNAPTLLGCLTVCSEARSSTGSSAQTSALELQWLPPQGAQRKLCLRSALIQERVLRCGEPDRGDHGWGRRCKSVTRG